MTILVKLVWMLFFTLLGGSLKVNCYPKGPWRLAFKVVSGKWNASTMGTATFWELFTSTNSYSSSSPIQDQRNFTATSDHYKSSLVEDWENKHISVQAIKLSFFKGNKEKAYIVFNGVDKTKESWFKCDNIMYSSYTDLDDTNTLGVECPGKSATGLPLTIMKTSYLVTQCTSTTGWVVVADTNFGFSLCKDSYLPPTTEPYFKYSNIATVANLTTQLEEADSIGIFFQVWDMVFKGVESVQPSDPRLRNLTGLFTSDLTQNDDSDYTVRNLQHNQGSQIFKSHVVNMWDFFHIETVKYALFKSGEEKAFFVFDAINTDKTSWFSQQKLLYSSYGDSLKKDTQLALCSIDGDTYRNWQIQSTAGDINGCTDVDQMGWTLIKEFKNNGTCSWDTNSKKKPYFQYNAGTGAAVNPENFQFADVMAVFVQGWRLVLKVSAGGSLGSKSSIYGLWTEAGDMNENNADAMGLAAETETYKSAIIDQWTTLYIRAVRIAAYKDGSEVFNVVFDATGSSNTDWLDCDRILYTSVSMSASDDVSSYTCSIEGDSFRFMVGKTPSCGAEASLTGILAVADKGSTCSERTDLPQFLFSNTFDDSLTDSTAAQLADTFAVFVDMASCYDGLCANDGVCQDIGGNYRCICSGSYYGNTCANLDGTYSEWSEWSTCSVTCGDGSITRTRTCSGTAGDGVCDGDSEESKPCTLDPCPINGGYSEWADWTTCTLTCGSGTQTRSRTCTNPAPQNGGLDCVGDATGTQSCNVDACPINGGLTEWTEWGGCSLTCGTGQQERTRTCTNPAPQNGGQDCAGSLTESQDCNTEDCPVNGGYTEWVEWSGCTKTCGSGTQSRTRTCTNPIPANGGIDCVGDSSEEQSCNTDPCPVDGGLTEWTAWGGCSLLCGTGQQERTRTCTNPAPQNGGQDCDGSLTESQDCNTELCPIHGGFTDWGNWTDCTVACGSGTQSRSRACTNPAPENGGDDCVGDTTDEQSCNTNPCPVNGVLSDWSEWGQCTVTCNGGTRERTRTCTGPLNGGSPCVGDLSESESCNEAVCPPVDGVLSDWSEWITCPVTCGGGTQSRSRTCTAPQNGGQDCTGDTTESQDCNTDPCPVDGVWSDWTVWGACSTTCGNGIRKHTRTCTPPENGGKECEGGANETLACDEGNCPPVDGGWTEWSDWSNCTKPCGRGDQSKSRKCTNPEPQWGGKPCVGGHTETHYCNDFVCPVDGGWGVWTDWVPCYNMTNDGCVSDCECGDGYNSRNRTCDSPIPQYEGKNCTGNNSEIASCTVPCCGPDMQTPCENIVNGGFSVWSDWDECSVTCGGGVQTRTRDCTNPAPENGGDECAGSITDSQNCNTNPCPVDGSWSDWIVWTPCSTTCNVGARSRSRTCIGPEYGGENCSGVSTESDVCIMDVCAPVDGGFSEWSIWGLCSVTCGGGLQTRTRDCTNPAPEHGGLDCVGSSADPQTCNVNECPVNGDFSEWSDWGLCSTTCGGGVQTRTRDCTNPAPVHGGTDCVGIDTESQDCNTNMCSVDGVWAKWTEWTSCTASCNSGTRGRTRTCIGPKNGGQDCLGISSQQENCNTETCPIVDGVWGEWTVWTSCTVSCNSGTRDRTHTCFGPENGGQDCFGVSSQQENCNTETCPPVDGVWGEWTEWTSCTTSCNSGTRDRIRTCIGPENGGQDCSGVSSQQESCNIETCAIVDGVWGEWTVWTSCTVSCNSGTRDRTHTCFGPENGGQDCFGVSSQREYCNTETCPPEWTEWTSCTVSCNSRTRDRTRACIGPENGGQDCLGTSSHQENCNTDTCPLFDGVWGEWTEWTSCTTSCNSGTRDRTRICIGPENGGQDCLGLSSQQENCNTETCPIVDGIWAEWTEWTPCTASCNSGTRDRTRTCVGPENGGQDCSGISFQQEYCSTDICPSVDGVWGEWTEWTSCTASCNSGTRDRTRTCVGPENGGQDCSGVSSQQENCQTNICPSVDGVWAEWTEWTSCTTSCNSGTRDRTRTCIGPENGGQDCLGVSSQQENCDIETCPTVDGVWREWTEWTSCTTSCNSGTRDRTRTCIGPENGGQDCLGVSSQQENCNTETCPSVDGVWGEWTEWTSCTVSCNSGTRDRTRNCIGPKNGGQDCLGVSSQQENCNTDPCPPVDGVWGEWSVWTMCTASCNSGIHGRTRTCNGPVNGGQDCWGVSSQQENCNTETCPTDGGWSVWLQWSSCTQSCGNGHQTRLRTCSEPAPDIGGKDCEGFHAEIRFCKELDCKIDGGWGNWSKSVPCFNLTHSNCAANCECGMGITYENRTCNEPVPQFGGINCDGDDVKYQACIVPCIYDIQCSVRNPAACQVFFVNKSGAVPILWFSRSFLTLLLLINVLV